MLKIKIISVLIIVAFVVFGCTKEKKEELDKEKYKKEFANLSRDYLLGLKSILKKNLKSGGPLQAVSVCSDTAADLTNMLSDAVDLKIKRVSLKNRNPNNIPDEIETKILHSYENLLLRGMLNESTETFGEYEINGEKVLRYMKPIIVDIPCLSCHGGSGNISKEVADVIKKNYPEDKAINYVKGDLRGAVSITKVL